MPAYEYKCQACGHRFERRQKMSEAAIKSCPQCRGAVERLISGGAGVIARGTSGRAGEPACMPGQECCGPQMGCGNACGCGE